jgi:Family of unknown function (DUF6527)
MGQRVNAIKPLFVEFIPDDLDPGVLYISERFQTTSHLCCCGCGREVVLPLSPAQWSLKHNGGLVSIIPSVGNWTFPCRAHYWIASNQIEWAGAISASQIANVKARDRAALTSQIRQVNRQRPLSARIRRSWNRATGFLQSLWPK